MNLKALLPMCHPESVGFSKLVKVSNNRLKKGNIAEVRESYHKRFNEVWYSVFDNYMEGIMQPIPYSRRKGKVNKTLRKLFNEVNGYDHTKNINVCTEWGEFSKSSYKRDIIDNRREFLEKFFKEYRNLIIKNLRSSALPEAKRNFDAVNIIGQIIQLYQNAISSSDPPLSDYYKSKQHVQNIARCNFIIAIRILEIVLSKFKLKLKPEFKKTAELAVIFENGVSAFSIGKKEINVLTSPIIKTEKTGTQNWQNSYRLHSTTDPAYVSGDFKELYYLHGVAVQKKYWKMAIEKTLKFEDWIKIKNIEERRVIIDEAGADCFAKHPRAEITEKSPHGNKLITIREAVSLEDQGVPLENRESEFQSPIDIKILNYKDPSTGREYNSFVPTHLDDNGNSVEPVQPRWGSKVPRHELTDPDEAMAWKFGKTKEEYYGELVAEA